MQPHPPVGSPLIFIVDGEVSVRESLATLLVAAGHGVETFASAREFLAAYDHDQPGCLLLDISMPGMSGLELQAQLNERRAILPIIFMTGHGDVPTAVEAMQAGAADFLQKSFRDHELLERVGRALARDAANRAVLGETILIRSRFASLTPRETQVMRLVVEGKPNKVIAGDLSLSQRTVEIHRGRVMEKMQAASLAHLVRMVLEAGEDWGTSD